MKAQYLKQKRKWTAFTTIGGLDIQEFGDTERQARENLAARIAKSNYLSENLRMPS